MKGSETRSADAVQASALSDGDGPARRARDSRAVRLIWWSGVISGTGDGIYGAALPLLAVSVTRDAALIAGITVASRLPWLVAALVTGAAADRVDRRAMMVWSDILRTGIVIGLTAWTVAGRVEIWFLYVAAFLLGTAETAHAAAAQALIPTLARPRELMRLNARMTSAQRLADGFVGPPIGTALFAVSPAIPFAVDAASFAIGAGLAAALPQDQRDAAATSIRRDIRDGVRLTMGHATLRGLLLVASAANFFYFGAHALLVLLVVDAMRAGDAGYTLVLVCMAAGTVLGQQVVGRRAHAAGAALPLLAAGLATIALARTLPMAGAASLLIGVGIGSWGIVSITTRQLLTPNDMLGRVNSAYRTAAQGVAIPAGAAAAGAVAELSSVRAAFAVAALGVAITSLAARRLQLASGEPDPSPTAPTPT